MDATKYQLVATADRAAVLPDGQPTEGPVRIWIGNGDRRSMALRLAAMCRSDRRDVLESLTEPGRIVAHVGAQATPRSQELMAELAAPGVTVLPERRRRGLRHLLGGAALVLAATLGVTAAPAPAAHAAVLPLTSPIAVTVSGPTARVDADVVSTSAMFADPAGRPAHGVRLFAGQLVLAGTSSAPGSMVVVHLGGTVPSRLLTPGTTAATLVDVGDGRTVQVPLTVLRRSAVAVDAVTAVPGGVLVTGRAMHYDIPTRTYKGDLASPVSVQRWTGTAWATVQTVTTVGADGAVAALVPGSGRLVVRLVRPAGATVTGGTSTARAGVALPVGVGYGC